MMRLPEAGEVFEGRYEIVSILGQGAFGRVYRARDRTMQRRVALKVLSPKGDDYSTLTAARFVREAKLLAGLQDPHTLTLFDFGEAADGLLFMATEFIEGSDLKQVLRRETRLAEPIVVHILRQLLCSLREAHVHGLLHRDIKPANIIVYRYEDDRYRVKLLDFGLAKSVEVDATQLTGAGRIAGTPRYMSPEQVLGVRLTPASDLYSLGLVAYEMLVGEPAIDGADMKEMLQAQVQGPPILVPEDFAHPRLRQIVDRMTERNLTQRANDAQSLLTQLDTLHRGAPRPPAPEVPTPSAETARPVLERRPLLIAIAIGAALFVSAVLFAALWPTQEQERQAPRPVEGVLRGPAPPAVVTKAVDVESSAIEAWDTGPPPRANGCGLELAHTRDDAHGMRKVNFGDREMTLVVPSSYDPNTPQPVVVMLHDALSTAVTVVSDTRVTQAAEKHGFIVVAPRDRAAFTWREHNSVDIVLEAIAHIQREACIDANRVYLWGNGFGAAMAQIVACERDDIAALATTYYRTDGLAECLDRPIPHIAIAGRDDRYAPIEGGLQCAGREVMSLEAQEVLWAEHNRCERSPSTEGRCKRWECEAPFVSCLLPGGRRFKDQPPRSNDVFNCDGPPTDVEVADLVWEFFARRSLSEDAPRSPGE